MPAGYKQKPQAFVLCRIPQVLQTGFFCRQRGVYVCYLVAAGKVQAINRDAAVQTATRRGGGCSSSIAEDACQGIKAFVAVEVSCQPAAVEVITYDEYSSFRHYLFEDKLR